MENRVEERPVKLVMLGEYAVGKTSLATRFVKGVFNKDSYSTIGACYLTKKLEINSLKYRYELWDCAGQERYAAITPLYYRNAEGAILVFDISNPDSFEKVKYWYEQLKNELENVENMPISLVANKVDLVETSGCNQKNYESELVLDTAEKFAKQNKLGFFKTSAKTGEGINDAFEYLALNLPSKEETVGRNENVEPPRRTINIYEEFQRRGGTCCQ